MQAYARTILLFTMCLASIGSVSRRVAAEVDVGRLVTQLGTNAPPLAAVNVWHHALSRRDDGKMRLFVTGPTLGNAKQLGLTELRAGLYAWTATAATVRDFLRDNPEQRVLWAPPKKTLLDHAAVAVHANVAHTSYGLSGQGVIVGIIDTGVDVKHPDLRREDGTSRVAWLLDMSKTKIGRHPDIEDQFDCGNTDAPCAVYSGTDIDELIGNDISGDEPRDTFGHGTHVASLAAGNGLSNNPPRYVGMAPRATYVVVRATRDGEGLAQDPDLVLAAQFIFAMADKLGMPAVINLSLGGDFGAHDGTSYLERELAALLGDAHPGRSMVVAAGNSGSLWASRDSNYPEPLGIHTTVQVPPYSTAKVPLLIAASAYPDQASQIYIWIASRPGDNLSVGLNTKDATFMAPVGSGGDKTVTKDGITCTIHNGVTESDAQHPVNYLGTAILIEGKFAQDTVLALTLEGHGTASIWLQPTGGLDPSYNVFGVDMPGAQREGTITVPATSPDLISVGATLDRTSWTDVNGTAQDIVSQVSSNSVEGAIVTFSAAGPNAIDGIKPDLVAPGVYIAGAMSKITDPRTLAGENGMFAGGDVCSSSSASCLVVDDYHALSMGTSMASPVVAGAVALLLERDPTLTQRSILRILQSGARNVFNLLSTYTQAGAGALDVEGALLALEDRAKGNVVSSSHSYLSVGVSFIRPDPDWSVAAMVHLRDDHDNAVDVESSRLSLRAKNGNVKSALVRKGPGFYTFTMSGAADSGGGVFSVELLLDGKPVMSERRPIAVDAPNVRRFAVAGHGCNLSKAPLPNGTGAKWAGIVALWLYKVRSGRRKRRASHSKPG